MLLTEMHYGETLPNGSILLRYKSNLWGDGVVMARNVKNEYVTWQTTRHNPDSTDHGNYFGCNANALKEAKHNFANRLV